MLGLSSPFIGDPNSLADICLGLVGRPSRPPRGLALKLISKLNRPGFLSGPQYFHMACFLLILIS